MHLLQMALCVSPAELDAKLAPSLEAPHLFLLPGAQLQPHLPIISTTTATELLQLAELVLQLVGSMVVRFMPLHALQDIILTLLVGALPAQVPSAMLTPAWSQEERLCSRPAFQDPRCLDKHAQPLLVPCPT